MATLFNTHFIEIDTDSIEAGLATENAGSMSVENFIISEIENSQFQQLRFLKEANAICENIWKNSSNRIPTLRSNVEITDDVYIYAPETIINWENNSTAVGPIKKGGEESIFRTKYWKLGDTVFIFNKIYSFPSFSSSGLDLISTEEMKTVFFLANKENETLYNCRIGSVLGQSSYDTVDSARIINYLDMQTVYFCKDKKLNMASHAILSEAASIVGHKLAGPEIELRDETFATKVIANSGTFTLKDALDTLLSIQSPLISNYSELPKDSVTNTVTFGHAADVITGTKAPLVDWEPTSLKKTDRKSTHFMETFVDSVLSGESIPDQSSEEYLSLASKSELDEILAILSGEIINMDICDDD